MQKREFLHPFQTTINRYLGKDYKTVNLSFTGDEDPALPETYCGSASIPATAVAPPRKLKGKKFSYQSTVRILEMRKLEEKLTREVAEKEKQRLKEMEAMKKVKLSYYILVHEEVIIYASYIHTLSLLALHVIKGV